MFYNLYSTIYCSLLKNGLLATRILARVDYISKESVFDSGF